MYAVHLRTFGCGSNQWHRSPILPVSAQPEVRTSGITWHVIDQARAPLQNHSVAFDKIVRKDLTAFQRRFS